MLSLARRGESRIPNLIGLAISWGAVGACMSNEKLTENNLIIEEADQYKNGGNIVWDAEDRRLAKKDQYNSKYRFIRWNYWFEKPFIKCHEAILLTLGFDPESTYYPERRWATEFNPEHRIALDERVENFKMLIGKGRLFESEKEGDLNVLVKLSDVAQYLDDRKISLPPELKAYIASKEDRCYQLQQQIEQLQIQLAQAKELIKTMKADQSEGIPIDGLTGLAKRNQLAQDRQGMARIIATSFWTDNRNILISDMANKVYAVMVDYCKEQLPQQPETIKNWIRPVAPKEAQRRGRQPKKSST